MKETTNISLENPEITAKLSQSTQEWRAETNAPVLTKLNAEYDAKYAPMDYVTWRQVQGKLAR